MNYARFEELRKEKSISRRELAKQANIPYDTLLTSIKRNSQTGIINTPAVINQIARILNCNISELLTVEELKAWGDKFMWQDGKLVRILPDEVFQFILNPKDRETQISILENIRKLNSEGLFELNKRVAEMASLEKYRLPEEK